MDLPGEARDGQECEMVLPTLLSKWQKRTHPGGTPDPGRLAQSWDHRGSKYCETRLNDHGIEPAPERKRQTPWKTFLAAHWDTLAAIDFFCVEILTLAGVVRYQVLFVIRLKTREVRIAGITAQASEEWMKQMARNLADPFDVFLRDVGYLIMDRDPLFTACFKHMLKDSGTKPVRCLHEALI